MERKYPVKFFWFFVLTNFCFHFFWLFLPGILLCVAGIWTKACLWAGIAVLILDLILSVREQLKIRKAAIAESENPEFNDLMDAFCGPDGLEAVSRILEEKMPESAPAESDPESGKSVSKHHEPMA